MLYRPVPLSAWQHVWLYCKSTTQGADPQGECVRITLPHKSTKLPRISMLKWPQIALRYARVLKMIQGAFLNSLVAPIWHIEFYCACSNRDWIGFWLPFASTSCFSKVYPSLSGPESCTDYIYSLHQLWFLVCR